MEISSRRADSMEVGGVGGGGGKTGFSLKADINSQGWDQLSEKDTRGYNRG